MSSRILYLVPPELARGSIANAQWLLEGLLQTACTSRFSFELVLIGSQNDAWNAWLPGKEIVVHRIPSRRAGDLGTITRIARLLGKRPPSLVHVWEGTRFWEIWACALWQAKCVVVDQDFPTSGEFDPLQKSWQHETLWPFHPFIHRALIRHTRCLVHRFDAAPTSDPATGDLPGMHRLIPPGIAVSQVKAANQPGDAEQRRDICHHLGIPFTSEMIGMHGAFTQGGAGKDAIWATDLLKCVRDQTHLVLFGDGALRWRLERFRWQTETEDRVHFLDASRFDDFLPHLHCYWRPAHRAIDSTSTLLQCMAAGIAVVASDLPAYRRVLADQKTGLLIPPGNRGALARKTDLLLCDSSLRDQIGQNARRSVEERFALERQIQAYAGLYAELIESLSP